jgi:hypothetical protein
LKEPGYLAAVSAPTIAFPVVEIPENASVPKETSLYTPVLKRGQSSEKSDIAISS